MPSFPNSPTDVSATVVDCPNCGSSEHVWCTQLGQDGSYTPYGRVEIDTNACRHVYVWLCTKPDPILKGNDKEIFYCQHCLAYERMPSP